MQIVQFGSRRGDFERLIASRGAQALKMTLRPGDESESSPSNEHPRSEQWMFVLRGSGRATIGKTKRSLRSVRLKAGSLLLIEKGELHRIRNTGRRPLVSLNIYIPPAYDKHGEPIER